MIRLDRVTKYSADHRASTRSEMDEQPPRSASCSNLGMRKTLLMKMINRLIPPSSEKSSLTARHGGNRRGHASPLDVYVQSSDMAFRIIRRDNIASSPDLSAGTEESRARSSELLEMVKTRSS
jgi:ABC-type proline/glycine betaine transport system ATPase subunit